MYERMLDKKIEPTIDQMFDFCNEKKNLLREFDLFMINDKLCEKYKKFPYGNNYGWCFQYRLKDKCICNAFIEKDAFSVMVRFADTTIILFYDKVSDYTRNYLDNKYPCSNGGWIHYRVLSLDNLNDLKLMITTKLINKKQ